MIITRSWSTLLCFKLCISDEGAVSAELVRNIAVPATRTGFDFSNMRISSIVGIESRWVLRTSSLLPRTQVHMMIIEQAARINGT